MPKELDALNEEVVITASIGSGFSIAHPPGHRVFSIEIGSGATVDGLPGVPDAASCNSPAQTTSGWSAETAAATTFSSSMSTKLARRREQR